MNALLPLWAVITAALITYGYGPEKIPRPFSRDVVPFILGVFGIGVLLPAIFILAWPPGHPDQLPIADLLAGISGCIAGVASGVVAVSVVHRTFARR